MSTPTQFEAPAAGSPAGVARVDVAARASRGLGRVRPLVAGGLLYASACSAVAVWASERLLRARVAPFTPSALAYAASTETATAGELDGEPVLARGHTGGVHAGEVELSGREVDAEGEWGLRWADGYARLGRVVARDGAPRRGGVARVRRRVRVLSGDLATLGTRDSANANAAICGYTYPPDLSVLQRELDQLEVPAAVIEVPIVSTGGRYPATCVLPPTEARARADATWIIAVHGRGSQRNQAYRMVPVLARAGVTTLAITYRGDEGTPLAGTRSGLGAAEWHELEAAVSYALGRGAQRIVLHGFSMGGAIVTAFLRRSALAPAVTALVLDAPVLDWGAVLRGAARALRLPPPVVPLTMTLARWRAGVDFALVTRLLPPERLLRMGLPPDLERRPTLLIHGTNDPVVPVASSDALAKSDPSVRYLRVPRAGHTTAYNLAPEDYESALLELVQTAVEGPPAPAELRSLTLPEDPSGF